MGVLIHGNTKFLVLVFIFLKYVIFCVHPRCDFLWYKFFSFSRTVCGYFIHLELIIIVPFIHSAG